MTRDVSVVGPLNVDLLITGDGPPDWESIPAWDGPAHMEMTAAGSVGYTVADMARLGLKVAVSSCVPDDPLGAFIVNALERNGVDTRWVRKVPDTVTGIGAYILLFGSRKRPLAYRLPTHEPWPQDYSQAEVDELLDAHLLHNGGYLHFKSAWYGFTVELFKEAKARGLMTSMDPQFPLFAMEPPWMPPLEGVLPYVDLLLCDEHEARNITAREDMDEAARQLLNAGPEVVVIKQGADGSTVYRGDWQYHQPAIKLGELVDSIGAGDAYDAAFLLGTLEDWSLERRALFASITAGFTVTGVGGSETMPSRDRIEKEMTARR
jgi:2-dehydro-3-deoxygluconokinase